METPQEKSIQLLVELEPRRGAFWSTLGWALWPVRMPRAAELGPWRDVLLRQGTPWGRLFESAVLHAGAVALIWMLSVAWLRQQSILPHTSFDPSSVITYSPQEYLPPLDTGVASPPKQQPGDPVYAKQPILSVPREADNRTQTIVVPPDLKLEHDVPLPNIVATGPIAPLVPLAATRESLSRNLALGTTVVAPAPDVDRIRDHVVPSSPTAEVVAPPPEVSLTETQKWAAPAPAVVAPPPDLIRASSKIGQINIGPSPVVAPAPQLAVAPQHTQPLPLVSALPGRVQPVAPPPNVGSVGATSSAGRLIALGIHPVVRTEPIPLPGGNRRGTFAAGPEGKAGAPGTPRLTGTTSGAKSLGSKGYGGGNNGFGSTRNGSLPGGLHVGAPSADSVGPVERDSSGGDGDDDSRLLASAKVPRTGSNAKPLVPVANEKVTEEDRQVFGAKRIYAMTLNMPNLNSVTGSWIMRFAELKNAPKEGELLAPVPTEQSDPGYPLELIREHVHGTVTLYAVIHSDGRVSDIRVLSSPDDRLDPFATSALARWKFLPALKAGKPVPLEAVVMIPFRARREF